MYRWRNGLIEAKYLPELTRYQETHIAFWPRSVFSFYSYRTVDRCKLQNHFDHHFSHWAPYDMGQTDLRQNEFWKPLLQLSWSDTISKLFQSFYKVVWSFSLFFYWADWSSISCFFFFCACILFTHTHKAFKKLQINIKESRTGTGETLSN